MIKTRQAPVSFSEPRLASSSSKIHFYPGETSLRSKKPLAGPGSPLGVSSGTGLALRTGQRQDRMAWCRGRASVCGAGPDVGSGLSAPSHSLCPGHTRGRRWTSGAVTNSNPPLSGPRMLRPCPAPSVWPVGPRRGSNPCPLFRGLF